MDGPLLIPCRDLNVSVSFNKCPVLPLITSASFILAQTMVSVILMLILRPLLSGDTVTAYQMALPFSRVPHTGVDLSKILGGQTKILGSKRW